MAFLQWQEVTKAFAGTAALSRFSLTVEQGEILALLGPSGSGKSTLLRITAGLEHPDAGSLVMEGRSLDGVPAHRRGMGLMFQDYCLFPHLNVADNIAFGLRASGMGRARQAARVKELLSLVRLEGFEKRDVLSLSGGEQQRIALARSLAPSPKLLLLDEPLGALDVALRGDLLPEMARILRSVGITVIYVTHDHQEALTVASRIALLERGRLVQVGTLRELLRTPVNAFCARFLGLGALVEGVAAPDGGGPIMTPLGALDPPGHSSGETTVLIRPEAIRLQPCKGMVECHARIVSATPRPIGMAVKMLLLGAQGREYQLEIQAADPPDAGNDGWRPGMSRSVWIDPAQCRALLP